MAKDRIKGEDKDASDMLQHVTDIVAAFVEQAELPVQQIPSLIHSIVHGFEAEPDAEAVPPASRAPAVPVNQSVKMSHIVCLEDGQTFKMLKRHLRDAHKLTPAQYRAKWGLDPDYPMTAPGYVARRSELAKELGFGRTAHQRRPRRKSEPPAE